MMDRGSAGVNLVQSMLHAGPIDMWYQFVLIPHQNKLMWYQFVLPPGIAMHDK